VIQPALYHGPADFDSVETYKEFVEQRAQALALISSYEYCHYLIFGFPKKKKKEKLQASKPFPLMDEYYELKDLEEEWQSQYTEDKYFTQVIRESMHHSYTNPAKNWYRPKINYDSLVKPNETVSEKVNPFTNIKLALSKEILVLFDYCSDVKLDLDYYSEKEVLDLAVEKLSSQNIKKSIKPRLVHLFHAIKKEALLTEFLRKYQTGNQINEIY